MSDTLLKTIFGRLTLESLPLHEPIVVATFGMVAIGGAALVAALTYFKVWGYLWNQWFTSVTTRRSASCTWCSRSSCCCADFPTRS